MRRINLLFSVIYILMVILVISPNFSLAGEKEDNFDKGVAANGAGDHRQAVYFFELAAHAGLGMAQYNLGIMYENGQGVGKDHREAVRWHRKAAEQGNGHAQYSLGRMYRIGLGISEDHMEAVNWYRKSADQGYAEAQADLGLMYELGQGVDKDQKEAVRWFLKAADQGLARGFNELAWIYATGSDQEFRNGRDAIQYAKLAVSIENIASYRDTLATAYVEDGQFEAAIAEYERAIELGGRNQIREYQEYLQKKSCYSGPIDGDYGSASKLALKTCVSRGMKMGID